MTVESLRGHMATVRPVQPLVVALLALVPVLAFMLLRPAPSVVLSVVSVVLIGASVYVMFGPTDAAAADHTSG